MGRISEKTFSQRRHPDSQQVHEKMLNITSRQGNANQNHNEISLHPLEWPLPKRQEITSLGKNMGKGNPCALLVRM